MTAVSCEPDLRHATVLLASLPEPAHTALVEARTRLQAAVAHQVRLKRTPLLSFEADPAVAHGERVEDILRAIHAEEKKMEAGAEDGRALGQAGTAEAGLDTSGPGNPGSIATDTGGRVRPARAGGQGQGREPRRWPVGRRQARWLYQS